VTLHDVEREPREAEVAPPSAEILRLDRVEVEVDRAQVVRRQRACVLDRSRRGGVELVDEHEHDVTLQDGRPCGPRCVLAQLFGLLLVLLVEADERMVKE
jgi:hypothetical protein